MGDFDKFDHGKTAPSCDYFFQFSHCGTRILVWSSTCIFVAQKIAVTFEQVKISYIDLEQKGEVTVVSVFNGNKEVKTNVTYFGRKYDFCKLHRADYDVIT